MSTVEIIPVPVYQGVELTYGSMVLLNVNQNLYDLHITNPVQAGYMASPGVSFPVVVSVDRRDASTAYPNSDSLDITDGMLTQTITATRDA